MKKILILMIVFLEFSALTQAYENSIPESINSTINADFLAAPVFGVVPLTVQFTDESSGNATFWEWDFDSDGKVDSTKKNPLHKFAKPGNYNVTLKVGNVNAWDSTTKSNYIIGGIRPVAGFTATPNAGKVPLTVKFTDTSTGNVTSWLWNFGDGSTSNLQSPNHMYYEVGNYKVSLTVSNAFEHSTIESKSLINVSSTPTLIADFDSNVTLGKTPLTVRFNDVSTGDPTVWEWDFNSDGQVDSKERNPIYTFKSSGNYTVTLRAGNRASWDIITKTDYIKMVDDLQAFFTISPSLGKAPLSVKFTDTSTGAPTSWLWDFGDGSNSTLQNPTHEYNQAGTYSVRLTASNNIGSNTYEIPSAVNVSPIIIPVPDTPVTDFNSNLTSGKAPLTVQFYDHSIRNPASWEWDFNSDGQIDSNEKNPVYEFINPGNYTVALRSGNGTAWGNVIKIDYITVGKDLQVGFNAFPKTGNAPLTVQFTDTSTGNVTSWLWDFGDGNTSTSQNPIHTYSETGNYTVNLNISNAYEYNILTLPVYVTITGESGSSSSESEGSGFIGINSLGSLGGSPEPASNIEAKVLTRKFVTGRNHMKFEFTKNATCVDFVEFDAKKTLGEITVTIEQLKGKSVLTPAEPEEIVYKYLNIWVGNNGLATPENIENATIEFSVIKTEPIINGIEEPTFILYRYAQGKWNPLNTTKTGEDDKYIYYEAKTPGFSAFIIASGKLEAINENMSQLIEEKISQLETPQNNEFSIQSKQPEKSETKSKMVSDNEDWSKISGVIQFFVVLIVALFIFLAVREKRK